MLKTIFKTIVALSATVLLFSCEKVVPFITVNEKAVSFEAAAGEKTVSFTTNLEAVTGSCPAEWVSWKIDLPDGSIKISVSENASLEARSAEIKVGDDVTFETIAVSQLGAAPSLLIDKESDEVAAEGGSITVAVTANTDWTASVADGADWLTVSPAQGSGSGNVSVAVAPNRLLDVREGVVSFKAGGVEKTLSVKQAAGAATRYTDSLALVAVYNAADGANWAKNNWDLSQPIDKWTAVTVNAESGRVTALKLSTANVITAEWTLPAEIGNLSELTDLRVNSNKLSGELPESLFGLTKLEKLYFQNNNLSGSLSSKIGNLSELSELYIDRNANLAGELAPICGLKKLKSINISVTSIGGSIPQELANCESLANFMAYSNKLEGQIPDIWDKLPNITVLQIYGNSGITGPIPATIGTLKKATGIQMKECNLTGNIPASFGGLEKCGNLQLNGNKLSGEVPAEVIAHPKWQPTSGWKYETNILPQQEGYGLTLPAAAPEYAPFKAQWEFSKEAMSAYADTFGTTDGTPDKNPGDGGCYVKSNVSEGGTISFVQIDKTEIDTEGKAVRIVGATGHPYVTGVWPGDYWLFTLSNGSTIPEGSQAHIKFLTRISATGHKFWMLEYLDGDTWKPAVGYEVKTESESGSNAQYNIEETTDSKNNLTVESTWTVSKATDKVQIRLRCVLNWQYNGTGPLEKPNGGTCRIAGAAAKEDGTITSPIFEVQ